MSKTVKEMKQEAVEAHVFYQFFKNHPDLSCEANEQILRSYLDENLCIVDLPNLEASVLAIGHKLATVSKNIVPAAQPAPKAVRKETEPTRPSLIGESRLSSVQLKRILTGRDFVLSLPAEYTRERIMALPAIELRALTKKYGSAAVNAALNR